MKRGLPKKGGLDSFQIERETWQERKGVVFKGGLIPQCKLCLKMHFENKKSVLLFKETQHASKLLELI